MLLASVLALVLIPLQGKEATPSALEIRFEGHQFSPRRLQVPAGVRLQLKVVNASAERIEFESFRLHREEVVMPGETVVISLPPLKAGSYDFFDDFHEDVVQGEIIAQ